MATQNPALEARGVSKKYKNKQVLRGVDFELYPGECLGVAGHNGSGKSTLLSIVAQVTAPDGGLIVSAGKNILGNKRFMRRMVGYVPQQDALLGDLTVHATLEYWRSVYGLEKGALRGARPVQMMGLEEIYKKRVKTLSGGMKKRVSVALALLHRPGFVLLDEAFSALDRRYREQLEAYLDEYRAAGGTILYCSHELEELLAASDRVLVLRDGERAFYGPVGDFPQDKAALDDLMNSRQ